MDDKQDTISCEGNLWDEAVDYVFRRSIRWGMGLLTAAWAALGKKKERKSEGG